MPDQLKEIVTQNNRWPLSFLQSQELLLASQLLECQKWKNKNAANLREPAGVKVDSSVDQADCSQVSLLQSVNSLNLVHSCKEERAIKEALATIQKDIRSYGFKRSDNYGKCEDCKFYISSARLTSMPYARKCTSCQEAEENLEKERTKQVKTSTIRRRERRYGSRY